MIDAQVSINGLILVGGKSTRMGVDKAGLKYHGVTQVTYLLSLLKQKTSKVFISVSQKSNLKFENHLIHDSYHVEGPINGIMSAFTYDPTSAWLVLAVDLPFITEASIDLLISHRNQEKVATTFSKKNTNSPEPLTAIWEPKSFPLLKNQAPKLNYSPKRVLMNCDIEMVEPENDLELFNANDKVDYLRAKGLINKSLDK